MSGLNPLGIGRYREFLGSSIAEWILFIAGLVLVFRGVNLGFLLMVFWIENFGFYIIPILIFQFYHWQAYHNKISLEEYLEIRRLKKLNKQMEKNARNK